MVFRPSKPNKIPEPERKEEGKDPNATDIFGTSSSLELGIENMAASSCVLSVLSIISNAVQEKVVNNTHCLVVKHCSW